MYRRSNLSIDAELIHVCMSLDTIFPTVSWVYSVRECYHETAVHTLELDNSQLRRSIILDHAHNGVTLTKNNCCDWCIFITSQNITRHLSFKTEYHASVELYELRGYNLPSLDDVNYGKMIFWLFLLLIVLKKH